MKAITIKWASFVIGGLLFFASFSAQAASINVNKDGVAIKGYDTVAYFTKGRALRGTKEFQHKWQNAKWFFSNEEHLRLFQEKPDKYAPQYGGF